MTATTRLLLPVPTCRPLSVKLLAATMKLIVEDRSFAVRALAAGEDIDVILDLIIHYLKEPLPLAAEAVGYTPYKPEDLLKEASVKALYFKAKGREALVLSREDWRITLEKSPLGTSRLALIGPKGSEGIGYDFLLYNSPPERYTVLATDRGARSVNEDSLGSLSVLYCEPHGGKLLLRAAAVADGVGGLQLGSLASGISIYYLMIALLRRALAGAPPSARDIPDYIKVLNTFIYNISLRMGKRMGTTVASLISVDGISNIGVSVGDTAIYTVKLGSPGQAVSASRINVLHRANIQNRHVLTSYIGGPNQPSQIWLSTLDSPRDAAFIGLIMTDGVHDYLTPVEIGDTISKVEAGLLPPSRALRLMIEEAKRRGSSDNLSIALIKL